MKKIIFDGCLKDLIDDGFELEPNGKYWEKSKKGKYFAIGFDGWGFKGDFEVAQTLIDKGIIKIVEGVEK